MELIRTVYLDSEAYLMLILYPDKCPTCSSGLFFQPYGCHEPQWDPETVVRILEATSQEAGTVQMSAAASCPNGHTVDGKLVIRKSHGQEAEIQVEYECVASTLASFHNDVEDAIRSLTLTRAEPGIFMPVGSVIRSTKGLVPPVVLGIDCEIASSAEVGPMTFVHRSRIGSKVVLKRCAVISSTINDGQAHVGEVFSNAFVEVDKDPD